MSNPAPSLWGKPLGEVVSSLFGITPDQIHKALSVQREKGGRLGGGFGCVKMLRNAQLAKALAGKSDLPLIDKIEAEQIDPEILRLIPITFAKQNRVLPTGVSPNGHIHLVCFDPFDIATQDELRLLFGKELDLEVAAPDLIIGAINKAYDRVIRQAETAVAELEEADSGASILEDEVVDLLDIEGDDEAPIIRLVNSLMSQAVKDRASDIHVEPFEREIGRAHV